AHDDDRQPVGGPGNNAPTPAGAPRGVNPFNLTIAELQGDVDEPEGAGGEGHHEPGPTPESAPRAATESAATPPAAATTATAAAPPAHRPPRPPPTWPRPRTADWPRTSRPSSGRPRSWASG